MEDILKDVVLHHTMIDWGDSKLTPNRISRVLVGHANGKKPSYWDDPEFDGMEPHEIERQILFEAGRVNWGRMGFYGKPNYQHFLMLMNLMFPKTDITPSLADAVMFFCRGFSGGRKMLNLIGCQNSSKSSSASRIAYVCMYIDVEFSVAYVANPFDNSADSTVWGDICELWNELVDAHPGDESKNQKRSTIFPKGFKYDRPLIEMVKGVPKAASIELKNVKHVGKYKGQKTKGKESHRGVMLVLLDEVNEIDRMDFLTVLTNIASQDEFFGISSQNFKDEQDMGGRLTEPDNRATEMYGRDCPATFDELDIERDAFWYSKYMSITLRFDGHQSPNILAKRTIYNYLFKQSDLERIAGTTGVESLDYYSQVRSFPIRGSEKISILSSSKVSSSRHKDPYYRMVRLDGAKAFCDPAFGGRDKAVIGSNKFGVGMVSDGNGQEQEQDLMIFEEHFHSIPLVKDAIYNDHWFERLLKIGYDVRHLVSGASVSYEDQIAIYCLEYCTERKIKASDFGYDFSMRPDIVASMIKFMGAAAIPFDYNSKPEGIHLVSINKNSVDYCKNRITELAFLAADLFLTKQVRGGGNIETAVIQLSRTNSLASANNKRIAEDKAAYKARWQQVSPDHRDVLMGLAGLAAKSGFRKSGIPSSGMGGGNVWTDLLKSGIGKAKTGLHLATR